MPSVFLKSSMPEKFLRSHCPAFIDAAACGTGRAPHRIWVKVSSAVATVLPDGKMRVRDSELVCAPGEIDVGAQATIGIRPEHVVVRRFGDDHGINSFAARLLDTEFFGNRTAARLVCEPLGIEIEADLPADHRDVDPLVPSSMVHIHLPQHALSVLAR